MKRTIILIAALVLGVLLIGAGEGERRLAGEL